MSALSVPSGEVTVSGLVTVTALPVAIWGASGNVSISHYSGALNVNISGGTISANVSGNTVVIAASGVFPITMFSGALNVNISGGTISANVSGNYVNVAASGVPITHFSGALNVNISGGTISANVSGNTVVIAASGVFPITMFSGALNVNISGGSTGGSGQTVIIAVSGAINLLPIYAASGLGGSGLVGVGLMAFDYSGAVYRPVAFQTSGGLILNTAGSSNISGGVTVSGGVSVSGFVGALSGGTIPVGVISGAMNVSGGVTVSGSVQISGRVVVQALSSGNIITSVGWASGVADGSLPLPVDTASGRALSISGVVGATVSGGVTVSGFVGALSGGTIPISLVSGSFAALSGLIVGNVASGTVNLFEWPTYAVVSFWSGPAGKAIVGVYNAGGAAAQSGMEIELTALDVGIIASGLYNRFDLILGSGNISGTAPAAPAIRLHRWADTASMASGWVDGATQVSGNVIELVQPFIIESNARGISHNYTKSWVPRKGPRASSGQELWVQMVSGIGIGTVRLEWMERNP